MFLHRAMRLITTGALARALRLTRRGTNLLVARLHLPFVPTPRGHLFDLDSTHPLLASVALSMTGTLRPLWTVRQLALRLGRCKHTVARMLRRSRIPVHRNGQRWFVLLTDLHSLR